MYYLLPTTYGTWRTWEHIPKNFFSNKFSMLLGIILIFEKDFGNIRQRQEICEAERVPQRPPQ